jgi:tetratricopeptide (TPR) repeat protein
MKKIFLIQAISILVFYQILFAEQSSSQLNWNKICEYIQIKAFDEAIAEAEKTLQQNPDNSIAHSNLAFARLMKHIEMFNHGLPIEQVALISKNGKVDLDEFDKLQKEWDKLAKELLILSHQGFKKAIELDDKNWHAHYFVGTHYNNIGKLKEAEIELKRVIELNPEYTNSYGVLASVYEKMGKTDIAIEYHKKDLKFDPDDDGARRDLALLYYRLGMKEEALKEYKILKKENSVLVPGLKPIFEPAQ